MHKTTELVSLLIFIGNSERQLCNKGELSDLMIGTLKPKSFLSKKWSYALQIVWK